MMQRAKQTYLLHDAGLALGEGNMATRLVADELDLDLAALATALLVVIIIVVVGAGTLHAARVIDGSVAVADVVSLVELVGRGLVVLIRDVGHCSVWVSRTTRNGKMVEMLF